MTSPAWPPSNAPSDTPFKTPPYRIDRRTCPDEALPALNAAAGRDGATAWRSATGVDIHAARRSDLKTVDAQQIEAWATHPDERVAIALAENETARYDPAAGAAGLALCRRALTDAQREGVVWTPVLDAIVEGGKWPGKSVVWATPAGAEESLVQPGEQVALLQPWIEAQTSPEAVLWLLTFQARILWFFLAKHARAWDDQLLGHLVVRSPFVPPIIAKNPHLPEAQLATLRAWALKHLDLRGMKRLTRDDVISHCAFAASRTLVAMAETDRPIPRETVEQLLALVEPADRAWYKGSFNRVDTEDPRYMQRSQTLYALLDPHFPITPDDADVLIDRMPREPLFLEQMAAHPAVTVPVLRHLMRVGKASKVRRKIATSAVALPDAPDVQDQLERSTSPDVLVFLAPRAEPERFRRLWQRIIRLPETRLTSACEVLCAASDAQIAALGRADLAPILERGSTEAKLRVLERIANLPDTPEAEPRPTRRPARARQS